MPKLEPVDLDFLDSASVVVSTELAVPFAADRIWPYLTDNAGWLAWFEGAAGCTGQPPIWTESGQTRTIELSPGLEVDEISVELTEPTRWAMTLVRSNLPMAKRMLEVVDLIDAGGPGGPVTTLRWTGALDPLFYTKPITKLLTKKLVSAWSQSFTNLAVILAEAEESPR